MTQPPPLSYAAIPQQSVDSGHLRALEICHYVWGGMLMLFSCFAIIYIVMGFLFLSGKMGPNTGQAPPPPAFIGYMFIAMGCIGLCVGWTLGGLTIYSGRCIAKRKGHTLSLVIAGLNCISFPVGTTLGVFSFIVLLRPSVKSLYL